MATNKTPTTNNQVNSEDPKAICKTVTLNGSRIAMKFYAGRWWNVAVTPV